MEVAELAHLRRARDLLDREYARPLDVPAMARAALMSPSLFSRRFREAYRDTPYGYLQARRVERAMALLRRGDMSVTEGFSQGEAKSRNGDDREAVSGLFWSVDSRWVALRVFY